MNAANETVKTIHSRHSVRMFSKKPVSNRDLLKILEAANAAPSAHNQQSWRFIVIRGKRKQGLAELISEKAVSFPKTTSVLLRMAARSVISAPVVVAVANTGELIDHGTKLFQIDKDHAYDFFRTMEIQSSAAAVENLLLAATSMNIATVWLGILFLIKNDVLEFLGERKGEFMAVIPMGFPLKESVGPKKRPIETIIKYLD